MQLPAALAVEHLQSGAPMPQAGSRHPVLARLDCHLEEFHPEPWGKLQIEVQPQPTLVVLLEQLQALAKVPEDLQEAHHAVEPEKAVEAPRST